MPNESNESPDILAMLREVQERGHPRNLRMTYSEWDQETQKAARGGKQSPINPGVGMMGHLNTSSRGSAGPNSRSSGNQGVGYNYRNQPQFGVPGVTTPSRPSRYENDRVSQPVPWIDDVDMASTWYSPMEPVWPFGPPYYNRPREWNYPVGYNLNYIPERISLYGMLRSMRQSWGVLAAIEATRMDQLLRMPWTIQRKDKPKGASVGVDQMRKFFRRPDGKLSYGQWSRKLLFDLFDIDAPCLYVDRNLAGQPRHIEVLDGATIFPLIDDAGRRPDTDAEVSEDGITYIHRQPAFQQIIYGLPMINLDETELIYAMMRPRPELPMFGYSPVEQIFIESTEAIRKTIYQTEFWRSGSMPELIITVPDNWTPRQIAMFQGHFDALLSGNLSLKSKVRFLPGGTKPFDIKNASGESLWSQRDELLVRLACYAFSVSPTPFVRQMNRGTAQNAQQSAQEEGLYPLMSWWKDDIMDRIIQEEHGLDDLEFVYLPRPEVDQEKQSKIHQVQVESGFRSRNEVRDELGEEPIQGGEIYTVKTSSGVIPLDMIVTGQTLGLPGNGAPIKSNNPSSTPTGQGNPQHGSPRANMASTQPTTKPTAVKKLAEILSKVSKKDIRHAAKKSNGDIDAVSHFQQKVGNFKKGHIWIQGLNISIENEKGSYRGEKDQSGKKWQVKMPCPYGYIRGTIGADNMQVDVYLGKHPKSDFVWVIDQNKVTHKGEDKGFDEHKVMFCYNRLEKALENYLETHFDGHGHERIFAVVECSVLELKSWLKTGDMKQPISEQKVGEVVLTQKDFQKADTISSSTGLNWYDQTLAIPRKKKKKKLKSGAQWKQLVTGLVLGLLVTQGAFAQTSKTSDYSTTLGTTYQQCAPPDASRKTLFIENPTGGTNNVCYAVNAVPSCGAAGTSVLSPGISDNWNSWPPQEAVNCIGSDVSTAVTIRAGR